MSIPPESPSVDVRSTQTGARAARPVARDGRDARWAAHRIARRQELVEHTLRAIRQHGPGVGMDDIAAMAGTSKTVLYRHFGDRQGLYLAVCESVDELLLRELGQVVAEHTGDEAGQVGNVSEAEGTLPNDLTFALIDAYLRLVERDPEVYLFVVGREDSPSNDPVQGLRERMASNLASLLTATHPGASAELTQMASWAAVGMINEAADRWVRLSPRPPRAELAALLTRIAVHGLPPAISGA